MQRHSDSYNNLCIAQNFIINKPHCTCVRGLLDGYIELRRQQSDNAVAGEALKLSVGVVVKHIDRRYPIFYSTVLTEQCTCTTLSEEKANIEGSFHSTSVGKQSINQSWRPQPSSTPGTPVLLVGHTDFQLYVGKHWHEKHVGRLLQEADLVILIVV